MKHFQKISSALLLVLAAPLASAAFESGSDGSDGTLIVETDQSLQLPPDGVFQFVNLEVRSGATLTFLANATNTPVFIVAQQDVVIDGTISVDGFDSPDAGQGQGLDGGEGGAGGPGAFAGGRGGIPSPIGSLSRAGQRGFGPGGGAGGLFNNPCTGGAGGYASTGVRRSCTPDGGGSTYGINTLIPLIGGSGGGGGSVLNETYPGTGGGGGGGAILIAASNEVAINGRITANGGDSGAASLTRLGGGGSGGAIRIVATTVSGSGLIEVSGGDTPGLGPGGLGRIRIEAENLLFITATNPPFSHADPSSTFGAGLPALAITSVAGIAVPQLPTGFDDVRVPETTPNPVTVELTTSMIPLDAQLELLVAPLSGNSITVASNGIQGTFENGSASFTVSLPNGFSNLLVTATFTVSVALNEELKQFTNGEDVQFVKVEQLPSGELSRSLIAFSGNQYNWPQERGDQGFSLQ